MKPRFLFFLALISAFTLLLASCSSGESGDDDAEPALNTNSVYVRPEIKLAPYDTESFIKEGDFAISIENISRGYVCAKGTSDKKLKFQVEMSGQKYNYDLNGEGKVEVFPLQMGNGSYMFSIFENAADTKYAKVLSVNENVSLDSEFEAFLRPNQIVNYDLDSKVVRLSNELTKDAKSEKDVVEKIYKYVTENIKYDDVLATNVEDGYICDVDKIIESGKGICFDYSALFAAMLRAQGIPTKLVTGYVSPTNGYHAWNMVYLKDEGWKYKKISIDRSNWGRVDTTFGAAGSGSTLTNFVGDGKSYADKYIY